MPKAPAIPLPPVEYEKHRFDEIFRALRIYFNQLDNPDIWSTGQLFLSALPTSAYNLAPGTVYRDGDILKIVLTDAGYVGTLLGTGEVGSVSVTIV